MTGEAEIPWYSLSSAGTLPSPQDGVQLLKNCLQESNQTKSSNDRNCN